MIIKHVIDLMKYDLAYKKSLHIVRIEVGHQCEKLACSVRRLGDPCVASISDEGVARHQSINGKGVICINGECTSSIGGGSASSMGKDCEWHLW